MCFNFYILLVNLWLLQYGLITQSNNMDIRKNRIEATTSNSKRNKPTTANWNVNRWKQLTLGLKMQKNSKKNHGILIHWKWKGKNKRKITSIKAEKRERKTLRMKNNGQKIGKLWGLKYFCRTNKSHLLGKTKEFEEKHKKREELKRNKRKIGKKSYKIPETIGALEWLVNVW